MSYTEISLPSDTEMYIYPVSRPENSQLFSGRDTENKKACNHFIRRLFVDFYISSSGVSGSPLEHLEVILAIIREVYSKK